MIELVGVDLLRVGDSVRFAPGPRPRSWWTVAARNEKHVVAVRQAAFKPKGTLEYTVTGTWNYQYNGQGPGLVRSSLNTLGGGWHFDDDDIAGSARLLLEELTEGRYELSTRRVINVLQIERKTR